VTASQLALASTRIGPSPGGYHSTASTSSATLQPLTHFSAQSSPFHYVTTNPSPQTTSHHTSTPAFQHRPVQGLAAAYGQVFQPSIQVAATPVQATYIAQPRPLQQTFNVGYGQVASSSSGPAYTIDRLPNPPEYPQGSYTSPQHHIQQQENRQWNSPNFP